MIVRWEIEVDINSTRSPMLIKILEKCGAEVRQEGRTIFINHPYVPASAIYEDALARAQKLVVSLNFLIRRLHTVPTELFFLDIIGFGVDGGKHLFLSIQETIVASCDFEIETHNANGEVVPPPELPTDRWKDLLLNNVDVSLVCELLDRKPSEWNDLYRSLEVIAEDVGGLYQIHELGWATKESIRRFKHTANSPSSIGLNARHGVDQGHPPTAPMILSEAVALIDMIVYQWIWSKT